jgi:uncharacterized membrane protein (DUF4010 family)
MMALDSSVLPGLAAAFGCGLLLGIERERRRGDRRNRHHPGVRSFALTGVAGALAKALGGELVMPGAVLVILLAVSARWHDRSAADRGIATELALFLCYLLGVAAIGNPVLAAGVAVVIWATLGLRDRLHDFVRNTLRPAEVRDGLILAAAVLVVRPLLPDAPQAWLFGVNLRTVWTLVVSIMAIQAAAHIALRVAGARLGLAASSIASGFISGVATIATLGARSRESPQLRGACVTGALASNVSTYLLLWIVLAAVAPQQWQQIAPLLGAGMGMIALVAGVSWFLQPAGAYSEPEETRVFSIRQAILFAVGLSGASAALAFANSRLGAEAAITGAALAGFFDVHAAAASAMGLLVDGKAAMQEVQLAVLLAISCNMVSKLAGAAAGGWRYAAWVGGGLALILAATWLPYGLAWMGIHPLGI